MQQVNVRNVDDALWREVKRRAVEAGISVGDLLNRILSDWLEQHRNAAPPDARERARRGRGLLSDLVSGLSLTSELRALRQLDLEREQRR